MKKINSLIEDISNYKKTGIEKGYERSYMNLNVMPGDDFAEYATGSLKEKYQLRDDQSINGVIFELFEKNQKQIQDIILEFANNEQPKGSLGYKIGVLYNQFMDVDSRNRLGYSPILKELEKIRAVKNKKEYLSIVARLNTMGLSGLMFRVGISPDQENSESNLVGLNQGGIGLPNRDYYFGDDEQTLRIREAYKAFILSLFQLIGYTHEEALKKKDSVYAIEERIAKQSYSKLKLRDLDSNYHKISYKELLKEYPGIDWDLLFKELGYSSFEYINIRQPEPIHEVEKILADTSLEDLISYCEFKIARNSSGYLSENFRKAEFEFDKVFNGMLEDEPLWKKATKLVNNLMGDGIGQVYCEKYFPESSKTRMLELVGNLKKSLAQRIKDNSWMNAETKDKALLKLDSMSVKVGYPNKWLDYSSLEIDEKDSLIENIKKVEYFTYIKYIDEHLNKPVDKEEWALPPQTVNAYYSPTSNTVCFPAGILQPPLFDPKSDEAMNYGSIGAVIGHEMIHGFDDKGRQFDCSGNRFNWWNEADVKIYEQRIKILEDHFSNIEVVNGKKINGKHTIGENIADNGGINIALLAMRKAGINSVIDGFTADQRFFLAYARNWTNKARPEYLERLIANDVHSTHTARVNGALPHIDAWYEAFGVKEGDKLYIPKEKRADIW